MDDLRGHFRPEFLNRLDEIILFKPLTKDNIGSIVDLMVKELNDRLADQELSLELTDAAKKDVIDNGYDPVYGARPLKRYLQKYVETLTARKILSGEVHTGDTLVLDVENGEYVVKVKQNHRIFWYHKTWTPFPLLHFNHILSILHIQYQCIAGMDFA